MKRYWITKFALTSGVFTTKGEEHKEFPRYLSVKNGISGAYGVDWWRTEEEAKKDVLRRIKSKRKTISKQIKKLDDLEVLIEADRLPYTNA